MTDRTPSPPPLHKLPPEELERRVREHLDAMWGELRAAGREFRTQYHPVRVARRHPFAAAAVAGAVVALVVRKFRRRAAPAPPPALAAAPPESLGRGFARSLLGNLASAAGRVLPALVAAWAARAAHGHEQPK